ncbi:MAG TPA: TIGR01440 family protein [Corynebacteriales bacterium]|nr:TIGR01440 family protein [Mycobacteriales bacterium]
MHLKSLTVDTGKVLNKLLDIADLKPGMIVVVGCSTSEVMGQKIGSASNMDVAEAIMAGLLQCAHKYDLYLAIQCCEHLNRALVVEKECKDLYGLEEVTVIPHQDAGGALATVAMKQFQAPVVVESISAHAGMDIGDTLIGMHLKRVAVPVRLDIGTIGHAHLTFARTRPKLIGGARAKYPS